MFTCKRGGMEVGESRRGSVLRERGREFATARHAAARSISRVQQCRLGTGRAAPLQNEELPETVTYSTNAQGKLGLSGAALFDGLDCGSR